MAQNVHAMAVLSRTRNNSYYRAAMEASPQYVAAAALRDKLVSHQQNLPGVPAVGEPNSADDDFTAWLAAVAEAGLAERAREAKVNALRSRIIYCDKTIEDVAVTETSRVLSQLHDDLGVVMAKVDDVVKNLQGARTPQRVIDAGVGQVWKQLRPLRDEYNKIRQAQEWAMAGEDLLTWSRSYYLLDDPVASDVVLRNLDEVFPGWKSKSANTFRMSDSPEDDPRPWPHEPIEQLVWFCTSNAEVWVPTISDLENLRRQRSARLNPPPEDTSKRSDQLLNRRIPQRIN